MTAIPAGILLPESVFNEAWFQVLAAVVAFNTLVYVGLSLSKLIPLPAQIHPSRVRTWLTAINRPPDPRSVVDEIVISQRATDANPYERMRGYVAVRDIPQAFALLGGFMVLMSGVQVVAFEGQYASRVLVQLVSGAMMLFAGQILGRRSFRPRTVMWTWALACVSLVGIAIIDAEVTGGQLPVAYALIVMVAFPPVTLAWRPALVSAALMFVIALVASSTLVGTTDLRIGTAAFVALIVGIIMLHLRLSALDQVSDEQARALAVATTDPLTGALTRNGLLSLMPTLGAIAERGDSQVCVMVFQLQNLDAAIDEYGTRYGQDLMVAAADSVREHTRNGDMVARWGQNQFVVAGLGDRPNAQSVAGRVERGIIESSVSLGKWLPEVAVGTAAGDPKETTFNALLAEAEGDMRLPAATREAE